VSGQQPRRKSRGGPLREESDRGSHGVSTQSGEQIAPYAEANESETSVTRNIPRHFLILGTAEASQFPAGGSIVIMTRSSSKRRVINCETETYAEEETSRVKTSHLGADKWQASNPQRQLPCDANVQLDVINVNFGNGSTRVASVTSVTHPHNDSCHFSAKGHAPRKEGAKTLRFWLSITRLSLQLAFELR